MSGGGGGGGVAAVVVAMGSYRWFVSGFALRGLHTWVLSVQQILIETLPCAKNNLSHWGRKRGNGHEEIKNLSLTEADILVEVLLSQFTCKLFLNLWVYIKSKTFFVFAAGT